jgi:hypothetical protein
MPAMTTAAMTTAKAEAAAVKAATMETAMMVVKEPDPDADSYRNTIGVVVGV